MLRLTATPSLGATTHIAAGPGTRYPLLCYYTRHCETKTVVEECIWVTYVTTKEFKGAGKMRISKWPPEGRYLQLHLKPQRRNTWAFVGESGALRYAIHSRPQTPVHAEAAETRTT